jgi:hypothetical protein
MTVELDHATFPSRDREAAAEMIARIFDVPWSETGIGPFLPDLRQRRPHARHR